MTAHDDPRMERALDLLAVRATEPLDAEEAAELERLLAALPELDAEAFDRVAASLDLEALGEPEPLPETLRVKLRRDADRFFATAAAPSSAPAAPTPTRDAPPPGRPGSTPWIPWALAAAAAVAAFYYARKPPVVVEVPVAAPVPAPAPEPTPSEARAAFLAAHPDALALDWAPGPDESGANTRGDVVWSAEAQTGFMRFAGLAPNDPSEAQYQLWIFDGEREHPVDGGVFDVGAEGEVIVPIDAKLSVARPTLFAVTVERPGGVVVSSKERIAALAKPVEG